MDLNESFQSLVDQEKINFKIVSNLNKLFGNDIKSLSKLKDHVQKLSVTQEELEKQLCFATTEAPDKISKAVSEAESALQRSNELFIKCNEQQQKVEDHREKTQPLVDLVINEVEAIQCSENVDAYQHCITIVQQHCQQLEWCLEVGNESKSLYYYHKLHEMANEVDSSRCYHLRSFVWDVLKHWNHILLDKFQKELELVLKSLKWPFTSLQPEQVHALVMQPPADTIQRLQSLLQLLLQLQLKSSVENTTSDPSLVNPFEGHFPPIIWPLKLLFKPLEVRFIYHFSGSKATNSIQNPEWCFTQVLKWLSLHQAFLHTHIQLVLNKNKMEHIIAKVELMRSLVHLVVRKLYNDLLKVKNDENLLCHILQETLNFERELRLSFDYPSSQPSVLLVLTQAQVFLQWIFIEKKIAGEQLDSLLSEEEVWCSTEESYSCGEQFILLLQGITDRYKPLSQPGHRLQFLQLQLDLLDDFRRRVLQVTKNELSSPLTSHYSAILNSVAHVIDTLALWEDMPFFVELHYFQEQTKGQLIYTHQNSQITSSYPVETLQNITLEKEEPISGSVFSDILPLYSLIQEKMLETLTDAVVLETKAPSQRYRKHAWFKPHEGEGTVSPIVDISPSLCPMLEALARGLAQAKKGLNEALFEQLWRDVANKLDQYLFEVVVLQNVFSELGALQLQFDATKALYPIFGQFTHKPHNFFKCLSECTTLLCLPHPTALLLSATLKAGSEDKHLLPVPLTKALQEQRVTKLTPVEAMRVINKRTDMNQ